MTDLTRGIAHLSASAIRDWIDCPLLWYGRRVEKWPEPPSVDLAMGKALHAAFEAHHADSDDPEVVLLREWAQNVIPCGPRPEALQNAVRALRFYRDQNPRQEGDIAERFFKLRVPNLPVPLVGYFDLVRGRELHEFKTGRARWGQKRVDAELQATAYWWAFGQVFKGVPTRLVYHLIATSPGAAVYRLETARTLEDMLDFHATARRIWSEITAGQLRKGCANGRCRWPERCADFA